MNRVSCSRSSTVKPEKRIQRPTKPPSGGFFVGKELMLWNAALFPCCSRIEVRHVLCLNETHAVLVLYKVLGS